MASPKRSTRRRCSDCEHATPHPDWPLFACECAKGRRPFSPKTKWIKPYDSYDCDEFAVAKKPYAERTEWKKSGKCREP